MVPVRICPDSGMIARNRCPAAVDEWFIRGSEPKKKCPEHAGRFKRWWRKTFGDD
jgi:hypothetical protein